MRQQKGSSSDTGRKRRAWRRGVAGGADQRVVVMASGRVVMASGQRMGQHARRRGHSVQMQPASAGAEREKGEEARGRRRGTDLVDVNCTEAGAAGTGRARGAAQAVRRRAVAEVDQANLRRSHSGAICGDGAAARERGGGAGRDVARGAVLRDGSADATAPGAHAVEGSVEGCGRGRSASHAEAGARRAAIRRARLLRIQRGNARGEER